MQGCLVVGLGAVLVEARGAEHKVCAIICSQSGGGACSGQGMQGQDGSRGGVCSARGQSL